MIPSGYCDWHRPLELGYVAWHDEADRRGKRGLIQKQCPDCRRFLWQDEWGVPPEGAPAFRSIPRTAA